MKQIRGSIIIGGILIFIFISITRSASYAQNSIKLGTFIPGEATPTPQATKPPPSSIPGPNPTTRVTQTPHPTHPPDPSPTLTADGTCHFSWPADDNLQLTYGKMHIAEYMGWFDPHGAGPTPTQDQWAFTEAQVYDFINVVSGDLYNRSFLYGKAVARLSMTQGFGLDKKQELHDTLAPLSCDERGQKVAHYLESPLFLYPKEKTYITLKLPSSITTPIDHKYFHTDNENSIFNFVVDTDNTIHFFDGYSLPYISYDNPSVESVPSIKEGRVVSYKTVSTDLSRLTRDVGLTKEEIDIFIPYFQSRLPKANYYTVSLIEDKVSKEIMPWTISPRPDTEIRLLFVFTPYLEKPSISYQKVEKVKRSGFTVLDFAGIIRY